MFPRAALAALAAASAAATLDNGTVLWTAYSGASTCYRQPLLVKASRALLAFVEGRPGIPYCSGTFYPDAPDFPILLRTSADGGATWTPEAQLTRGNLDFLVAVYDPAAARVHLLVQQGDTGTIQLTSDDAGATWSAPAPVVVAAPAGVFASLIPGVGHGLALSARYCVDASCGGRAGRLVVPFVATRVGPVSNDTACGTCATALVVSDDGGATWALGAVSDQNGSREAALAQLDSADFTTLFPVVYAAERNLGAAPGVRLHAESTDGGATFSAEGADADLPDVVTGNWTGVVAGFARVDAAPPARASFLFTAPAAVAARANLSLWVTPDVASWGAPRAVIWPGPAAYSDALQINATHVGVLFESSTDAAPAEFAGGIRFVALAVAALADE